MKPKKKGAPPIAARHSAIMLVIMHEYHSGFHPYGGASASAWNQIHPVKCVGPVVSGRTRLE